MKFKGKHLNLDACLFCDCSYLTIKNKFKPFRIIKTLKCTCRNCEKDCPCYEDQLHYQEIYKDYFKNSQK